MKKKKKKKGVLSTIFLVLVLLVGLSLLLYPTFSNYWNSVNQSHAIAGYIEGVSALDEASYEQTLNDAYAYNEELAKSGTSLSLTASEYVEYESTLNIPGTDVMAYIEIPKVNCYLPIYHGTDEAVLQVGVGHVAGTGLPVGGESTHAVISGHRGLPSAKLFTDLNKLEEGDTFVIYVLNETLTYEVDRISIVEPNDLSEIQIVNGMDYCTLLTCTPYGINTHRLLVRGHRIENGVGDAKVTSDALVIEPVIIAPILAIPMLPVLWIIVYTRSRRRKRDEFDGADARELLDKLKDR